MTGISNEVLAILVIAAMAISLAGTFTTLSLITEPEGITGFITGITNVSLPREADITLNVQLVEFGEMNLGAQNDTGDYSPHPFVVENNGSVFVNVTVYATDLWASAISPTANYSVNASDDNETTSLSTVIDGFVSTYIDMPNATGGGAYAQTIIACMNYTDSRDAINVHINITVPPGESTGTKTSTVTFTGNDAVAGNCGE
jgi:hypothetical protein